MNWAASHRALGCCAPLSRDGGAHRSLAYYWPTAVDADHFLKGLEAESCPRYTATQSLCTSRQGVQCRILVHICGFPASSFADPDLALLLRRGRFVAQDSALARGSVRLGGHDIHTHRMMFVLALCVPASHFLPSRTHLSGTHSTRNACLLRRSRGVHVGHASKLRLLEELLDAAVGRP